MAGSRRPLTHTLTHTGKRADGDNGHKSSGKDGTPERTFKVGGERRNPNLVGAGVEPVLQIFTDFEPLSFHIRFF